ncbi:MAG: ATP-binding protein [Planctomycetaceae bacterium]
MPSGMQFELQIPSDTREALKVQDRVIALMEQRAFSSKDVFAMRLAMEEALTNAIKHGNRGNHTLNVRIECDISDERVRVVVADEGTGFNPDDVPDPTLPEFIGRAAGRGLILMRAYMDLCRYNDRGNQITMERFRDSERPIVDD